MSYVLDTYEDETTGCRVEITIDEMAESPREWSNVFSLCLKHRDYTLVEEEIDYFIESIRDNKRERFNDRHDGEEHSLDEWEVLAEAEGVHIIPTLAEVEEEFGGRIFPVYAYIHSGIALSTSQAGYPFNDVWDSGQLGFALVSNAKIQEEFLNYYPDPDKWTSENGNEHGLEGWLYTVLKQELSALEDFWMGNVYCIDSYLPDGESCWDLGGDCGMCGIYDDDAHKEDGYLRTEARNLLSCVVNNYQDSQADGMLAMDIFAATELVLS